MTPEWDEVPPELRDGYEQARRAIRMVETVDPVTPFLIHLHRACAPVVYSQVCAHVAAVSAEIGDATPLGDLVEAQYTADGCAALRQIMRWHARNVT